MKIHSVISPSLARPACKPLSPRFGRGSAAHYLIDFIGDFPKLGYPYPAALHHLMFIYGAVIALRILIVRSLNERLEALRRDSMGWFMWFCGSPWMQTLLVAGAIPFLAKHAGYFNKHTKDLMVQDLFPNVRGAKKVPLALKALLNPDKVWRRATEGQLKQRQIHMMKAMRAAGVPKETRRAAEAIFERAIETRGLMSLIGFIFVVLFLGIGIPLLNIAMTHRNVIRKQRAQTARQNGYRPAQTQPFPIRYPYLGFQRPMVRPQPLPYRTTPSTVYRL
jgi:hypothetical protein